MATMPGTTCGLGQRAMAQAELFTDAALADGRSPQLVTPISVLVRDGILVEIYEGEVPDRVPRNKIGRAHV